MKAPAHLPRTFMFGGHMEELKHVLQMHPSSV